MEGSIIKKDEENKLIPKYKEIFFIENGSQSNIYCSTKLRYPSTTQERFLVGTLKGKVSCLERCDIVGAKEKFHSSHDMQAREVYFSYIPGKDFFFIFFKICLTLDELFLYCTFAVFKCTIILEKHDLSRIRKIENISSKAC